MSLSEAPIYDEPSLITRFSEGDEAAFNALFARYRDRLYHYLLRITKSPEISEDMVVDIFIKLWVGHGLLHDVRDLEGFLHKVAYNKAMDFFKTVSRHERLQRMYIKRMNPEPEKTADELLIDAECRQILLDAVNQLPPQRKLIYNLSREQGLTHEQIAQALNLSKNTVKNTMVSATKSISEYLQKNYPGKAILGWIFFLS